MSPTGPIPGGGQSDPPEAPLNFSRTQELKNFKSLTLRPLTSSHQRTFAIAKVTVCSRNGVSASIPQWTSASRRGNPILRPGVMLSSEITQASLRAVKVLGHNGIRKPATLTSALKGPPSSGNAKTPLCGS